MKKVLFNLALVVTALVAMNVVIAQGDNKDKDHKREEPKFRKTKNYSKSYNLGSGDKLSLSNQFGKMIVPDFRGDATIHCKFGALTAGKISNAREVEVEFGEATIEEVHGGKLSIKFSQGTVNKLSGDVNTDLSFSQVKLNIDNDAKVVDIHNSYSTVYLDLNKNLSATYDIQS